MNTIFNVISSVLSTLLLLGCLWLAQRAYVEVRLFYNLALPTLARLVVIIAVAGLIYTPATQILFGLLAVLRSTNDYFTGWYKAAEFVGAAAVLIFVGWLYVKGMVEDS